MKGIHRNNRIGIVLIAAVLLLGGISFSVNDTFSRYRNESYNMVTYEGDAYYAMDSAEQSLIQAEASGRVLPEREETFRGNAEAVKVLQMPSGGSPLIMEFTYPDQYETVVLAIEDTPFPKEMRYSHDGIKKYVLASEGNIEVSGEKLLFLEIPDILMKEQEKKKIACYFYSSKSALIYYNEVEIEMESEETTDILLQGVAEPIMEEDTSLTWSFHQKFADTTYEIQLQYLSMEGYTDIPVAGSLTGQVATDDSGNVTVTINNSKDRTAFPGTYRVVVTQTFEWNGKTCQLQSIHIPFFVNYR